MHGGSSWVSVTLLASLYDAICFFCALHPSPYPSSSDHRIQCSILVRLPTPALISSPATPPLPFPPVPLPKPPSCFVSNEGTDKRVKHQHQQCHHFATANPKEIKDLWSGSGNASLHPLTFPLPFQFVHPPLPLFFLKRGIYLFILLSEFLFSGRVGNTTVAGQRSNRVTEQDRER